MKAFVYRSGLIGLAEVTPEDALEVGEGPEDVIRAVVNVIGRHHYNNVDLICPGVPEAGLDGDAAVDAVIAFREKLNSHLKCLPGDELVNSVDAHSLTEKLDRMQVQRDKLLAAVEQLLACADEIPAKEDLITIINDAESPELAKQQATAFLSLMAAIEDVKYPIVALGDAQ